MFFAIEAKIKPRRSGAKNLQQLQYSGFYGLAQGVQAAVASPKWNYSQMIGKRKAKSLRVGVAASAEIFFIASLPLRVIWHLLPVLNPTTNIKERFNARNDSSSKSIFSCFACRS